MERKLSAKFQQGRHKQGGRSAQQWSPTVLSTSSGLPWEPGLPWRALLFCQLRPPPSALINACPGVLSSEAEAAFFKALLIDGGMPGGTHSSRSKCLHGPFLFSPDPWGTVSWYAWLPPQSLPTVCIGSAPLQNRLRAEAPKTHCQKLNPRLHDCRNLGRSPHLLLPNLCSRQ